LTGPKLGYSHGLEMTAEISIARNASTGLWWRWLSQPASARLPID
jgi:hypothetical protein